MMGAGGITEAITAVSSVSAIGVVPPTLNLDELDEKCASLNYVPHGQLKKSSCGNGNSFGLAGRIQV